MTQWFSSKQNRALPLFMGCELLQHLKEQSESLWPVLMPAVSQSLCDQDPEVRIPAAYAVKLAALCPAEVQAWQLVVNRLPLKDDEEEARKVHESLADLVLAEHSGLCGAHLGKVLSALAEVYRQEEVCAKETDAKVLQLFQRLPRESLTSLAGSFSQKQQKKIEKMLTSA